MPIMDRGFIRETGVNNVFGCSRRITDRLHKFLFRTAAVYHQKDEIDFFNLWRKIKLSFVIPYTLSSCQVYVTDVVTF